MRLLHWIFVGWITFLALCGCALKEKKEVDNSSTAPKLKDFERVLPPVLMTNPQDRAGYMIVHYWENFNFTDTMYCHAPQITDQAFVNFISLFPHASMDKVSEGVKKMLDAAEVDVVMYNYFLKLADHYLYAPLSQMRNDEFYIPFMEQVVASTKVTEVHKQRTELFLQLLYRNRPGSKAEDFVYTTSSGQSGRLHAVSAPYTLLMFYNPDCADCKVTTASLKRSPVVTTAVSSGQLKILAVFPDQDLDIWRSHLNEIPSSWINGYDKTFEIRTNDVYDLKAMPTLYLLNKDKIVILKDISVDNLNNYLSQINSN